MRWKILNVRRIKMGKIFKKLKMRNIDDMDHGELTKYIERQRKQQIWIIYIIGILIVIDIILKVIEELIK
jgi:hypothetical protein